MTTPRDLALETARYLKPSLDRPPRIGYLTGTGLSDTLEGLTPLAEWHYADLPHFPVSTVESHKGRLVYGSAEGRPILAMQGRFHLYEGYAPVQVSFPVRVMQELGVRVLILSNAAGGVNLDFSAGDIMVIQDHINLTGQNPLTGPHEPAWGLRFPDMTRVYDPDLIRLAEESADSLGLTVRTGVYAGLPGPSLETPAETRFLKTVGADAVGFSTIMEAIAGVHAGMKILGLSLITNINDPDAPAVTTLESVLETADKASAKLSRILGRILARMEEPLS